jgi:hypothetical protein
MNRPNSQRWLVMATPAILVGVFQLFEHACSIVPCFLNTSGSVADRRGRRGVREVEAAPVVAQVTP